MIENISFLHQSEINCSLDLTDFDNDNEDKKEIDESEKIHQSLLNINFRLVVKDAKNYFPTVKDYQNLYFKFTTPPPELI